MARNGSGTEVIPNTLVAGTPITASDHNENYADIASEITNSLALDGQSTMTGQFKASNGTAGAPGISFGSDTDTGFYRSASNELSGAVGGSQAIKVSSSGVDAPNGRLMEAGATLLPPGSIIPFGGSAAPAGWLLCYGQAVSRSTYADLYAAIGTAHGTGDGSTTFNVPDLRGRAPIGKDDMGGSAASRVTTAGSGVDGGTLGATGGAQNVTIAAGNLPQLSVMITDPGHTHATSPVTPDVGTAVIGQPTATGAGTSVANVTSLSISTASTGISATANTGGANTALNKVPPVIVLSFIIKY